MTHDKRMKRYTNKVHSIIRFIRPSNCQSIELSDYRYELVHVLHRIKLNAQFCNKLYLNKLEFPGQKDAFCHVWLKLAH